jgi:hypothetical protein
MFSYIKKVLYGMHMVEHPHVKSQGTWRKLVSSQRKRAVMACFRMAPLYSMPQHRAINLFLKSYKQCWLDDESQNDTDLACLIPDLCPEEAKNSDLAIEGEGDAGGGGGGPSNTAASGAAAETPAVEGGGGGGGDSETPAAETGGSADGGDSHTGTPDPLKQLICCFNRAATTEQGNKGMANLADDALYQVYADIMSKSCEIIEEEEEEGGGGSEEAEEVNFQEAEMVKQKLLYEQSRLADRGATEMCLLYISASRGEKTDMLEKTLQLGISLLHGGNVSVQQRM